MNCRLQLLSDLAVSCSEGGSMNAVSSCCCWDYGWAL